MPENPATEPEGDAVSDEPTLSRLTTDWPVPRRARTSDSRAAGSWAAEESGPAGRRPGYEAGTGKGGRQRARPTATPPASPPGRARRQRGRHGTDAGARSARGSSSPTAWKRPPSWS